MDYKVKECRKNISVIIRCLKILFVFLVGFVMYWIKEIDVLCVIEIFGRSEVVVEKEIEEERFWVVGIV